ncbi:hypothetical protein B9Z19DRAFT_1095831 [Tuber borchii]|uniref:Uncharacterized protein n=1 Tax=Tuber borchii TaxID=42251 RepID=A0A2T6ZC63_TUBBO|nr:hypothetical protein B9Z19DRAFT_1095831 [Tuber borchii]
MCSVSANAQFNPPCQKFRAVRTLVLKSQDYPCSLETQRRAQDPPLSLCLTHTKEV